MRWSQDKLLVFLREMGDRFASQAATMKIHSDNHDSSHANQLATLMCRDACTVNEAVAEIERLQNKRHQ